MLVSWTWLSRYVDLGMSPSELADRLSLSGLNHEETVNKAGEWVIDLEVTSNRGDCLSHIGVAREIAVLYDQSLKIPQLANVESAVSSRGVAQVFNEFPEACLRYTARIIKGCKVKPSPRWLADSLASVGIGVVNNVVDVTNYVMMECGQPLHAFDLDRLTGPEIHVRRGRSGEIFQAIDHKQYPLDPTMCVIADSQHAVAIAGVMGGATSEVSDTTRNLLIEAAIFTPVSVRQTARTLKLHSPSSFRFERKLDPEGVDWASRRASEMILELAGGELLSGCLDTNPPLAPAIASPGDTPSKRSPVVLRLSQIERILGIQIDRNLVVRVLSSLGCRIDANHSLSLNIVPPSWRHDLTREIDMIEEVARIHGYDKIPEDSPVAVIPSAKREWDHGVDKVRSVMSAAGISEAMTPSVITESLDHAMSPWTNRPALETITTLLKGANRLRRTLLSSLVQSRADNWTASSMSADLYEIAHVYLPGAESLDLPSEQTNLGIVCSGDFMRLKGVIETLIKRVGCKERLTVKEITTGGLDPKQTVSLHLDSTLLGYLGVVDKALAQRWKLPMPTCVAELDLQALLGQSTLVPQFRRVSPFPSIERDLNMIVNEGVQWIDLETSTRGALGAELVHVQYKETYRAVDKDGPNTKRILFSIQLRRDHGTLTGEEADAMIGAVIARCGTEHNAKLLA